MSPSGNKPALAYGWKEIAGALGVSVRKAQEYATRDAGEKLPIRRGHRGIYAYVTRLQDWVDVEDMAYATHIELQRARRDERVSDESEGPRAA